jgi:hypothetical protein
MNVETKTALDMCQSAMDALDEAGLVRTSKLSGGELTGWTDAIGSTGFSCLPLRADDTRRFVRAPAGAQLMWHVVISGKPHLRYTEYEDPSSRGDTIAMHSPDNPELLFPRISAVFAQLGFIVQETKYSGCQGHWDDDVEYNVFTDHPSWLEKVK